MRMGQCAEFGACSSGTGRLSVRARRIGARVPARGELVAAARVPPVDPVRLWLGLCGLACIALLACNRVDGRERGRHLPSDESAGRRNHQPVIHRPAKLTHIDLPEPPLLTDVVEGVDREPAAAHGGAKAPGREPAPAVRGATLVACETCHSIGDPRPLPSSMTQLATFHQGLEFRHGPLACASCHVRGGTPRLHLADATEVATSEAMQLCQQCHGPQFRDYRAGSHGGMTGYWNLAAGPRQRNHCVDCHDAHSPAIRPVLPAEGPRDRFFARRANGGPHSKGPRP